MRTLTLTEFNQNPSRATRLADEGDVVILRRGAAAYRLVRIADEPSDPVEQLLATGFLSPPRAGHEHRRTASTSVDLGAALDADRGRLDG
ncbi:MAG: type II toxin-antitoxin system Phd/YefM family antitoxin [Micrococcales bacterium]|nr:type II toxin-antitoxin system Phd/YefM family antitoxin [Micrococcales bacterium]MCL2666325.1 type II toxin-antitoxin system Phd/YefM family antitoxin [Micrococcales bacterium]